MNSEIPDAYKDKLLNERKKWYKQKYIMRETLDGKTFLFFEKNAGFKKPSDTLVFVGFPDVHYDKRK